ncbi:hypothetical protein [Azospirillum sp. SYSU D00513]|uniref:hypothetical protein n=1 Tax=Azospirillum sp. SYSU D00513 TaxID=2812561 RepID=UPI001A96DF88|nr:hypothetical protein [Azospirillum sp. SYSU D00513]
MAWIDGNGEQTAKGLDTLLQAVETLPHAGADAWQLDLLRTALRIARATEAPVDLERAGLAFKALPPDTRTRLADHAADLARRNAEQLSRLSGGAKPQAGRIGGYFAGLFGRSPPTPSGSTAKERLLRDIGSVTEP